MKKKTLFEDKEMGTILLEAIRLYEPEENTFNHFKKLFERFTVPELKSWADNLIPLLKHKKIEVVSNKDNLQKKSNIESQGEKILCHQQNL